MGDEMTERIPWRPADWVGQPDYCGTCIWQIDGAGACACCASAHKAGASAMLKAVIKYLGGGCPHGIGDFHDKDRPVTVIARKDCPECWADLQGEK